MKTLFKSMFVLFAISYLVACTKDSSTPSGNNNNTTTSTPTAGSYVITLFNKGGDQTSTFSGFTFDFSGNSITATSGTLKETGSWTKDDDNSNEIKISFSSSPLSLLNRSWGIVEITDDRISLKDDDASSSDDDKLIFTRK